MKIVLCFIGIYVVMRIISGLVNKNASHDEAPLDSPADTGDDLPEFIDRIEEIDAMLDDDDGFLS